MSLLSNLFANPKKKGELLLDAISSLDIKTTERLIEKGAELNLKLDYYNGETALFIAARYCKAGLVRLLIEKGADLNVKNNSGETPLYMSLKNGTTNSSYLDIAQLLIKNGAKAESKHYLLTSITKGYADICKLLIENGADLNVEYDSGETVLYMAIKCGHLDIARILIDMGVNINAKNRETASASGGDTALFIAAEKNYVDMVRHLIAKGASVNEKKIDGCTALFGVARKGYLEMVSLLIEKGANINAQNKPGDSLLLETLRYHHDKTASAARLLIENGAAININAEGILSFAAEYPDIIKLLIEKGTNIRKYGSSALRTAAERGYYETVQLLVANGADVNEETEQASTALTIALGNGHQKIAELLIENGANVNVFCEIKDAWGDYHKIAALKFAQGEGFSHIAQLLKNAGASE